MNVKLLYHTPNPERAIASAARLCYSDKCAGDLMDEMSDEKVHALIVKLINAGHLSAFEHAAYTFAVDGVSRALTHQLVRHRIASFNQQSQRYVKIKGGLDVVKPETVSTDANTEAIFDECIEACREAYEKLLTAGVPAEDARYVLPNATQSKIVVTMNARELLHFFSLRCCKRAQWEIRDLACKMLELAKESAPTVFEYAGAGCVRGACPEGENSCKK